MATMLPRLRFELLPANDYPLIISPEDPASFPQMGPWLNKTDDQKHWFKNQLLDYGALLFRGFPIYSVTAMHAFCEAIDAELMDYPRGISPRTEVDARIYTSTEAPPHVPIPIHTEMSYTSIFPRALVFCCLQAPGKGGETPLADMRKVLARLPPDMVAEFEAKGIFYHQYAPSGRNNTRSKTWQDMFATEDKKIAEEKCAAQNVQIEWLKNDVAKLTNPGQVVRLHPVTGERIWFNQIHIFHHSMSSEFFYIKRPWMGAAVRSYEFLIDHLPAGTLPYPYGITFGDHSPVPREYIMKVRQAIWAETISFPWQKGDLLLVDNLRVGHGRFPFDGKRKILAALVKSL